MLLLPHSAYAPSEKPSTSTDRKKKKKTTPISAESVIEKWVTLVDDELAHKEHHQKLLKENAGTVQPYIVCIGTTLEGYSCPHVQFLDHSIKVPTLLDAFLLCFKVFFVFDLEYPRETQGVWELFQFFYGIPFAKGRASACNTIAIIRQHEKVSYPDTVFIDAEDFDLAAEVPAPAGPRVEVVPPEEVSYSETIIIDTEDLDLAAEVPARAGPHVEVVPPGVVPPEKVSYPDTIIINTEDLDLAGEVPAPAGPHVEVVPPGVVSPRVVSPEVVPPQVVPPEVVPPVVVPPEVACEEIVAAGADLYPTVDPADSPASLYFHSQSSPITRERSIELFPTGPIRIFPQSPAVRRVKTKGGKVACMLATSGRVEPRVTRSSPTPSSAAIVNSGSETDTEPAE